MRTRALLLLAAVTAALATPAAAQTPDAALPDAGRVDLVLRGVPADAALAAFAAAARVNVAYSTALVGTRPVWCGAPGSTVDRLLRCITDAVGLDYVRRSSGTFVVTERVVEAVRPGAVAGLVVDAATGEALPFATVRVAGVAAVTDAAGRFSLVGVAPGPVVLTSSYVGYVPASARLAVEPGGVATATVALRPVVASVGAVVVDGLQRRDASERLGADAGFETLGPAGGASGDTNGDAVPPLARSAPAVTSSVDGPALRTLLGVSERTFRDGLSMQGGEAGEHVLQIDGATVYEPLAVGPTLGALSPLAVGRVTVRKAGFGARHGSHLAGVLQAEHDLARPDAPGDGSGRAALAAEADAYAASARVRTATRLGTWRGEPVEAVALVAARRSLWDVRPPAALDRALREWNSVDPVLAAALGSVPAGTLYDTHRHGSDVSFSDVHAAARVRVGALRSVRASLYRGTAGVATEVLAVGAPPAGAGTALLARDGTHWTNLAATVRGDAVVSARVRVGGGARLSRHTLRQRVDTATGADAGLAGTETPDDAGVRLAAVLDARGAADNGHDLLDLGLSADATVALSAGHEVTVGVDGALLASRFHLLAAGYGLASFRDLDARHTQARVAAFADGSHRLGGRWTVEPGLRLTALAASGDVLAEPRLAVRYDARPGDRLAGIPLAGVAARVAAGVYRQFASRVEFDTVGPSALVPAVAVWLPSDATVAPASALHVAAEALWQPSAAWELRAEGYAKALPHVYRLDYRALLTAGAPLAHQADFLVHETGRALGVGVRLARQAPRWAASAGIALARTERRSDARFGGRWVPAPWAEPLRATLALDVLAWGRRDGTGVLARARGLGVWGRSWAYRRAYYDVLPAVAGAAIPGVAFDRPEDDRLPPHLALDVGLAVTRLLGDARRLEVAADVANVLGRRNVLDWSLRPDGAGGVVPWTRTLPGVQPSLRVRLAL